jgi:hypothetical protein
VLASAGVHNPIWRGGRLLLADCRLIRPGGVRSAAPAVTRRARPCRDRP